MKRCLLSVTVLFVLIFMVKAGDTIPANHPFIEYTGRIDFSDSLAPVFSYSGVSIRVSFEGTGISAVLSDDQGENYYNVILDGSVYAILKVDREPKPYVLASGLEDGIHEVELFKRTELTFGKTTFHGFLPVAGTELVPHGNVRDRLIEFIGNSITCGYGNEGDLGGRFTAATENHYMTYAAMTSRKFNARHRAICRSGIGIYRNYNGPAGGNENTMTNNYSRIFLYDEQPLYDFTDRPDVICINLGTNDFSTSGGDSALYVQNYLRLIDTLQTNYQQPRIVLLLGSMLGGEDLVTVRNCLEFVADSAARLNRGEVTFFEMSEQTGEPGLGIGIDYHPTVAQHRKNAAELTAYLSELMSWELKSD